MLWLPTATHWPKGRTLTFAETTDPKGCLHTTETTGWPSYTGWTVHPHVTIRPIKDHGIEIRQHVPFNRASFALRNLSGGAETNRDYVFQFELIGTCEKNGDAFKRGAYYWPNADDKVLTALYHRVIKPMWDGLRIPIRNLPFQSYPSSYGPITGTNNVRLSGSAFDTYSGWLGHQHVPENTHGDPGAFPWDRMMELIRPITKPVEPGTTPPTVGEMWEGLELICYYDPATDTDGKGPDTAESYAIAGDRLRYVSGTEVAAIRKAGGNVIFVPLAKSDPLWKMEKFNG